LGSQPKQGLARLRAKREARESHCMFPGVKESVREWTLTLPRELPFWESKSRWIPEFSESDCRSQNSMDWKVPYIIKKILERTCLKWDLMTHSDIWNTSYDQKKGRESNCQFDSRPLKSGITPISLCAGGVWHTIGKLSMRATTLLQTSCQAEVYTQSYGPPKSWESQMWEFRDSHLGVPGQNVIWMWTSWHKVYYKAEGGDFPQVRVVLSVSSPSLPWLILAPKMFWLCTNQLVVLFCASPCEWLSACHSS
jgi:hypothetical protein